MPELSSGEASEKPDGNIMRKNQTSEKGEARFNAMRR
jgi:hypothetical protein